MSANTPLSRGDWLSALVVVLIWGLNFVVMKLGLQAIRHAQAAVQTLSAGLDTLLADGPAMGARRNRSSRS